MTQTQRDTMVTVKNGRAFAGSSQWGYRATVDADGTVRVYDDVAGHYTTLHGLTERQMAQVRRRARAMGHPSQR